MRSGFWLRRPIRRGAERVLLRVGKAQGGNWLGGVAMLPPASFQKMKNAGVSFYDEQQNRPQHPAAARPIPDGELSDYF